LQAVRSCPPRARDRPPRPQRGPGRRRCPPAGATTGILRSVSSRTLYVSPSPAPCWYGREVRYASLLRFAYRRRASTASWKNITMHQTKADGYPGAFDASSAASTRRDRRGARGRSFGLQGVLGRASSSKSLRQRTADDLHHAPHDVEHGRHRDAMNRSMGRCGRAAAASRGWRPRRRARSRDSGAAFIRGISAHRGTAGFLAGAAPSAIFDGASRDAEKRPRPSAALENGCPPRGAARGQMRPLISPARRSTHRAQAIPRPDSTSHGSPVARSLACIVARAGCRSLFAVGASVGRLT
jgi:hypothetical protein